MMFDYSFHFRKKIATDNWFHWLFVKCYLTKLSDNKRVYVEPTTKTRRNAHSGNTVVCVQKEGKRKSYVLLLCNADVLGTWILDFFELTYPGSAVYLHTTDSIYEQNRNVVFRKTTNHSRMLFKLRIDKNIFFYFNFRNTMKVFSN